MAVGDAPSSSCGLDVGCGAGVVGVGSSALVASVGVSAGWLVGGTTGVFADGASTAVLGCGSGLEPVNGDGNGCVLLASGCAEGCNVLLGAAGVKGVDGELPVVGGSGRDVGTGRTPPPGAGIGVPGSGEEPVPPGACAAGGSPVVGEPILPGAAPVGWDTAVSIVCRASST